jgi:hypothetical protein
MHLSFLVMKERLERDEIEMESGSVGVANVEVAAGEVEVTGVDIEFVAGNARGDGAAIAEKSAVAMGVGVANVEVAAGEVGVTGVDIEFVAGNACCDRIRHF